MEYRVVKKTYLNLLTSFDLEIVPSAVYKNKISDLYIKQVYFEGKENDFSLVLKQQFKNFIDKLSEEISNVNNVGAFIKVLKKELLESHEQFLEEKEEEEKELRNYHIPISANKIKFVSNIRDIQQSFITKTIDHISELLEDIEPTEHHHNSNFKLKFNLNKKETVLLLILLEEAGVLENAISNNKTARFIEKYFQYKDPNSNQIAYKDIKGLSSLLSQIKSGEKPLKESINDIKEMFDNAAINKINSVTH